jgi:hypothetical protein
VFDDVDCLDDFADAGRRIARFMQDEMFKDSLEVVRQFGHQFDA